MSKPLTRDRDLKRTVLVTFAKSEASSSSDPKSHITNPVTFVLRLSMPEATRAHKVGRASIHDASPQAISELSASATRTTITEASRFTHRLGPVAPLSVFLSRLESGPGNEAAVQATTTSSGSSGRAPKAIFVPFLGNVTESSTKVSMYENAGTASARSQRSAGFTGPVPSSSIAISLSYPPRFSTTSITGSATSVTPPPPPVPSQPHAESLLLTPATIGAIAVAGVICICAFALLALLTYRERHKRKRPSYLEAATMMESSNSSRHLQPLTLPYQASPRARAATRPAFRSPFPPPTTPPIIFPVAFTNPYYAALAFRDPSVFGPADPTSPVLQPTPTPPLPKPTRTRARRGDHTILGWERTRLSGIFEELEGYEPTRQEGADGWRDTLYMESEEIGIGGDSVHWMNDEINDQEMETVVEDE